MSFESEYRKNIYYENIEKSKVLQKITRRLAPEITSESDRRYVTSRRSKFEAGESPEDAFRAKALEAIMGIRIAQGAWFNDPADDTYSTEPIWTNDYDDISNRVDMAATVHVTKDSPAHENADLTFGIDVTTSNDPDTITDKLLVGSNNPRLDIPVGFSEIKYYRNRKGEQGSKIVPRYCIGISSHHVDDILEMTEIRPDNSVVISGGDSVTRFKILYEMSIQNQLFEGALYHQEDTETISDEHEALLRQMEALDAIYVTELEKVIKQLPPFATRGTDMSAEKIALRLQKGEYGDDGDDTFRMICEQTEAIASAMFDSDEPDKTLRQLSNDARQAKRTS